MKRKNKKKHRSRYDALIETPLSRTVVAILTIALGIVFILQHQTFIPISRSEALTYIEIFDKWEYYRVGRGGTEYVKLFFENEDVYTVHYSCVNMDFEEKINSISKGEEVSLLVNPENDYVIEITTENEEIFNLDSAQAKLERSSKGFVGLGIFCVVGALVLLVREFIMFITSKNKR